MKNPSHPGLFVRLEVIEPLALSVTEMPEGLRHSSRTMAPGCTGFLIAIEAPSQ